MAQQSLIQFRRGTAAQWASSNPVLAVGEIGFEQDTNNFKIGTGSTSWTVLPYGSVSTNGISTLTNKTLVGPVITSASEGINIVASAATGTINYFTGISTVWYYTSNATANFTLNFTGTNATSINNTLTIGQSISCVFLNTNGSTAYYPSAYQVDGVSITPKWQGGVAPTAGNTSAIDSYSFVIMKTGNATFTVLGSQNKFA
jgi:hypothetical protein